MAVGTRPARAWRSSYKDNVKIVELENELRPLLSRFAQERNKGERFGDFFHRAVPPAAPVAKAAASAPAAA